MNFRFLAVVPLLCVIPIASAQEQVFADDFDASTSGLNVVPSGWTVSDGTVDVVGGGFCAAGLCVDLDGSTGDAGVLSRTFQLTGGTTYTLRFDLSGSRRGGSDDVSVSFGSASLLFDGLAGTTPYATFDLAFTPDIDGSYSLSFSNAGGDNVGAVLDNVRILAGTAAPIPEPSTVWLGLAGIAGIAAWRQASRNRQAR